MSQPESLQQESGGVRRLLEGLGKGVLFAGIAIGAVAIVGAEIFALQDSSSGFSSDSLSSE